MQYFYNNNWYTYEELHNQFGITDGPANPLNLYDYDVNEYTCWEFNSETWVTQDVRWYPPSLLPYYRKTANTLPVYLIDQQIQLDEYNLRNSTLYNYTNHLYDFTYIHEHFGVTRTPSNVYYVKDGNVKCWHNPDQHIYWDVDTNRWYDYPPHYDEESGSIIDVEDINEIGACGLFTYYNPLGTSKKYGSVVSADHLKPICLKFPASGEIACTQMKTDTLTGAWRLLSAVPYTSISEPCIVFAMRVSDENINTIDQPQQEQNIIPNNVTTYIEYDF